MKNRLEVAVEKLISKSGDSFGEGLIVDRQKWNSTNKAMGGRIPEWFIDLFNTQWGQIERT